MVPILPIAPEDRGRVALRLTDNLEEVSYIDRIALRAVDHPEGTTVLPREGLRPAPPYVTPTLHLMDRVIDPVSAHDGDGHDWLPELLQIVMMPYCCSSAGVKWIKN